MASKGESLTKDLVCLLLQYLDKEKFKETVHMLEMESSVYFNLNHFEELMIEGAWDELDKYLSAFTKVDSNRFSMKLFFEIRKQKYVEALDRHDHAGAVDILINDLKVFASENKKLFEELAMLLTMDNFREDEKLSNWIDAKSSRVLLTRELKKIIELHPDLKEKLHLPVTEGRLQALLEQSLKYQHSLCDNPRQILDSYSSSLFEDHRCDESSGHAFQPVPVRNELSGAIQRANDFYMMNANVAFQNLSAPSEVLKRPGQLPEETSFNTHVPILQTRNHPIDQGETNGLGAPIHSATIDVMSRKRRIQISRNRVHWARLNNMINQRTDPVSSQHPPAINLIDDLPRTVSQILNQGTPPTSMDFHPKEQTLLLVGTAMGEISLWEVSTGEKLISKSFHVWNVNSISTGLKADITRDLRVSANRVRWSQDGLLAGIAYSKNMVHLYTYFGTADIQQHLEIEAHVGAVNDIAFANPEKKLTLITCGDDKTIKVWDATTGNQLFTFVGHKAPVYNLCPHCKDDLHFLFSTSMDGRIKAWLYDTEGPRVNNDVPGGWFTTMSYSADGKRLFSCGTTEAGECYIVEWNETEGTVKSTYQGSDGRSSGLVHFDISKTQYLAAGIDYSIKLWDVDHPNLLTTINANGGIPVNPLIRFNKEGTLLAVSANDNRIKILATLDGIRFLHTRQSQIRCASRLAESGSIRISAPFAIDDDGPSTKNFTVINRPDQCRSIRLPSDIKIDKIWRLAYNRAGHSVLALGANAVHVLWKWPQTPANPTGKAITRELPQLWKPASGIEMNNDVTGATPEAVQCFALSMNESYLISASGGGISLFNMMTFKPMAFYMNPPPVTTFLAFHPQDNNIIAIGLDDSNIQILNIRINKLVCMLRGHTRRISGLIFSQPMNILISSGADSQVIVWNSDNWERVNSTLLWIPAGKPTVARPDTHIQVNQNQSLVLTVHETVLAIYGLPILECLKQWSVPISSAPISHATFSCDSQWIYAGFLDGSVRIFLTSNLEPQCRIDPTAYLPSTDITRVYPHVIAAHPIFRCQFALGLTDGGVMILEPHEGKWPGRYLTLMNSSLRQSHPVGPPRFSSYFNMAPGLI